MQTEGAAVQRPSASQLGRQIGDAIAQRRGFSRLLDKMAAGDILIVTKLDCLDRDAIDVSSTVKALAEMGVRVYCLALGRADLTSPAGTMTMNVLNAVAQFERDLLIERTQSGLKRAKSEGKSSGRPSTLKINKNKRCSPILR